jgi:hypothetical protein
VVQLREISLKVVEAAPLKISASRKESRALGWAYVSTMARIKKWGVIIALRNCLGFILDNEYQWKDSFFK